LKTGPNRNHPGLESGIYIFDCTVDEVKDIMGGALRVKAGVFNCETHLFKNNIFDLPLISDIIVA
jgi:hypothetical protein